MLFAVMGFLGAVVASKSTDWLKAQLEPAVKLASAAACYVEGTFSERVPESDFRISIAPFEEDDNGAFRARLGLAIRERTGLSISNECRRFVLGRAGSVAAAVSKTASDAQLALTRSGADLMLWGHMTDREGSTIYVLGRFEGGAPRRYHVDLSKIDTFLKDEFIPDVIKVGASLRLDVPRARKAVPLSDDEKTAELEWTDGKVSALFGRLRSGEYAPAWSTFIAPLVVPLSGSIADLKWDLWEITGRDQYFKSALGYARQVFTLTGVDPLELGSLERIEDRRRLSRMLQRDAELHKSKDSAFLFLKLKLVDAKFNPENSPSPWPALINKAEGEYVYGSVTGNETALMEAARVACAVMLHYQKYKPRQRPDVPVNDFGSWPSSYQTAVSLLRKMGKDPNSLRSEDDCK